MLPLDDAAIERLLDWRPDDGWILVERDERRWCEGRISRETRAQVMVGFDRVAVSVLLVAGAWAGQQWLPLHEVPAALIGVVVVLMVAWAVSARLRRWHERS